MLFIHHGLRVMSFLVRVQSRLTRPLPNLHANGVRALPFVLLAAACATVAPPMPAPLAPPPPKVEPIGLTRVLGHYAATVIALLGAPSLDRVEGRARELQFTRGPCVLDLFLYPPDNATGDPVVTYVSARLKNGQTLDAASCLQSQMLTKK